MVGESSSRRDAATHTRDAYVPRSSATRFVCGWIVVGFFFAVIVARAASPIALPSADWIAAPKAGDVVHFRKSFTVSSGLQSAVLLGASAGRATAFLNGERVGECSDRARAASFDVSRQARVGSNVLEVAAARGKPDGVAFILQLVFDTGRHEWIVTNGSWLSAMRRDAPDAEWQPVAKLGRVDAKADENPFDPARAVDAYNSWTLARGVDRATDPATIRTPPGFTVDLLRSALPGEDSWIAMAFDPHGRITVAREKAPGLLRLTLGASQVEKVEVIEETLRECRGLLYAFDALYVHANHSKTLVRLRDTDGDDRFDEAKELLRTEGGSGHGRNHLRLGPDGLIYLIAGDDVALPPLPAANSSFRRFAPPPWIPGGRDPQMFDAGGRLLTGYLARTDREGARWEIVAGGLRNALDVAFNEEGEIFTYEADNERDIGNPWYQPSRVHHLVSGGDYAWRRGTGVVPSSAEDVLPTMHDVGLGSPTGVEFGTRSAFPEKYRHALFIGDWAYGRILALHLTPRGASYTATRGEFAVGRPLNVTDLAVGPDGALYFTTGGRGTQSGLYRVRYTGGKEDAALIPEDVPARAAREVRHQLEALHTRMNGAEILPEVWPHLGAEDRWIRNAARLALETVPPSAWRDWLRAEADDGRALTALLALVRIGDESDARAAIGKLDVRNLSALAEQHVLEALRIYEIALPRIGPAKSTVAKLDALYPASSGLVNRELCKLLVNLRAPGLVAKTTALLAAANTQEDRVHFLFFLRHAMGPWTLDQRRIFFAALRQAEQGQGAQNYLATVRTIKTAVAAALSDTERAALAPLLEDKTIVLPALAGDQPRRFVRDWSLDDFATALERVGGGRSFAKGKEAFAAAMCLACHRVGAEAGGVLGPDLTAVASRFGRRDLLEAILNPSRAMDEKFRSAIFHLKDGRSLVGTIESENAETIVMRPNPLVAATFDLRTSDVAAREWSEISPMPTGLLNGLEREQILDLLAYLESGGNPEHTAFRAAPQK